MKNYKFLAFLFTVLILVGNLIAADFESLKFRWQMYGEVHPTVINKFEYLEQNRGDNNKIVVPFGGGLRFNPLIMPFYRVDLPFDIWIGGEINDIFNTTLEKKTGISSTKESIKLSHFQPSVTLGFSFNLFGPVDVDVMGGYGFAINKFTHDFNGAKEEYKFSAQQQLWTQGGIDIQLAEINKTVGIKLGAYIRQNFFIEEDFNVVKSDTNDRGLDYPIGKTNYKNLRLDGFQIGLKLSLDFGRESNKSRNIRHKLYHRDDELRKHNQHIKPLDEWECMAVERDYRLYIDASGQLADVRHKFNRTEYLDIMETYLAFCKPEDLDSKLALYRAMDSNKVVLKNYQVSQSDKRYRQVMASNDVEMLEMFLKYYPDHPNKVQIQEKITHLGEFQDWSRAKKANVFKSYLWYINKYPEGKYVKDAETGVYNLVKSMHRIKDYEIYIKRFPNGVYIHEARKAIHQLKKNQF